MTQVTVIQQLMNKAWSHLGEKRLLQYVQDGRNIVTSGSLVGATSLAGFGNVGLTSETNVLGTTKFGVAVDLSKTELTAPDAGNVSHEKNLWFFLDAIAEEDHTDEGCQVNRLGYQSWAIVRSDGSRATHGISPSKLHGIPHRSRR